MLQTRVIGTDYLTRYCLIPANKYCNIYLHHFIGSDEEGMFHDHPWWSVSFMLKGCFVEHCPGKSARTVSPGSINFRGPFYMHRLELKKPAWTLFITGPETRDWGFVDENKGWEHHKKYSDISF